MTAKEQIFGNVSVLLESYGNSTTPYEIVFHAATNIHIDKMRLHHRGLLILCSNLDGRKFINCIFRKQNTRTLRGCDYLLQSFIWFAVIYHNFSGKNVDIETLKRDQHARIIQLLLKQPLKHGWFGFFNDIKNMQGYSICGTEKKTVILEKKD